MKRKNKAWLAESNEDSLGLGLGFEISENTMNEMRRIVNSDMKNIERDYEKQLYRLDEYLKKSIGVIPKNQNFVKWFFDKKKIAQWGKNLPKISDEEIIEYATKYLEELEEIRIDISNKRKSSASIWALDHSLLQQLAILLKTNGFISEVENFIAVINNPNIEMKVSWGKSIRLLVYLFMEMKLKGLIYENVSEVSIVENRFKRNQKDILYVSQTKHEIYDSHKRPKGHVIVEKIIDEIKNLI